MPTCIHDWVPSGRAGIHAYGRAGIYVRCSICGQVGFRFPERRVVYTWHTETNPPRPAQAKAEDRAQIPDPSPGPDQSLPQ